ncbi:MAG: hypothetical protein JST53_00130 [Actinobacteria bacterium]|nr:hypothetical protein [Actinomycetota bacterium]
MAESKLGFPSYRIASVDSRERGRMMGEEAKQRIDESLAAYEETFGHYTGLPWSAISRIGLEFAVPIERYDREILEEIEGLAEGSGRGSGDLLALNARSEIMFGLKVKTPPECTAFFAGPSATADGHVLLGQNWDWRPRAIDSTALFEIDQGPGRPAFVMLPEAGLVGKTGFNECGVGVTLNALVSDRDLGERGVPIHVVLRGILNATTLEEAYAAIVRARRGASANYTIASRAGYGLAVEAGPGGIEAVEAMRPQDDLLAHANHFVCESRPNDVGLANWPDSVDRFERLQGLLAGSRGDLTVEKAEEMLADEAGYPDAISRVPNAEVHPVEQAATVFSIVMDLTAGIAEVAGGPPSTSSYARIAPSFAR